MQAAIRETPIKLLPKVAAFQAYQERGQLLPPDHAAQAILWLASHFARTPTANYSTYPTPPSSSRFRPTWAYGRLWRGSMSGPITSKRR